jgi:hypothetical protein
MFKKVNALIAIVSIAMVSVSCFPDGAEYIDELDIVYTNYDDLYNFKNKSTFAVPDKVIKIDQENVPGEPGFEPGYVSPAYSTAILASIRSNMRGLGYTEVTSTADPDLIILPAVFQTDQLYFYYDWWYWSWFYPGWGAGWGWYYPGYYPPQVTRIRTGSVIMQMTDPKNQNASDQISVVWIGVINGLLEGNVDTITSRISTTINQAFEQSPYLAK